MKRITPLALTLALMTFTALGCGGGTDSAQESAPNDSTMSAANSGLPLVEIMQALETDLAGVANGIWTRDPAAVRTAAIRVADHPKVTAEQMTAIKNELGSDFSVFVQFDQMVHNAAVDLAAAADSSSNMGDLFVLYHNVQQGCMSCHAAFQTRVSEALAANEGGS